MLLVTARRQLSWHLAHSLVSMGEVVHPQQALHGVKSPARVIQADTTLRRFCQNLTAYCIIHVVAFLRHRDIS